MNNNNNPYRAPTAELADAPLDGELELAGRGHRFGAAMIDGAIESAIIFPIGFATGMIDFTGSRDEPLGTSIVIALLSFVLFAFLHSYFLKKKGQTIGKKIVGIRIVTQDGNTPTLGRLLGARYGIVYLFNSLPVIGSVFALIDVLFIFRRDRRCIHDLVAGTRVVLHGARLSSVAWFVLALVLTIVIGLAAVGLAAIGQYDKLRIDANRPGPASSAAPAPAQHAPAPVAPTKLLGGGARTAVPENPAPTANEAAPAPAAAQPSDADLGKCAALKDPAAVIRCSQGGR